MRFIFERIVLFSLFVGFGLAHAQSELSGPFYRNEAALKFGAFSYSSSAVSLSGVGAIEFSYRYYFSRNWAPFITLGNAYQFDKGGSSIASIFDFGVSYCVFNCVHLFERSGDMVMVSQNSRFGLKAGLGFAQRGFQLSTTTVSYSGFALVPEVNYFLNDRTKILATVKYSSLSNSTSSIQEMMFSAGLSFDFGSVSFDD